MHRLYFAGFRVEKGDMKIGQKIRRLRKLRGLTIEELSDHAALTKGLISQLERDKTVPTIVTLKQVLDVLGVELATFFDEFQEREKNIFTIEFPFCLVNASLLCRLVY